MPKHCSVSGCKSNYASEKERVTTFAIPKMEPLRSTWLRRIPTDFSGLKDPRVCIKHFLETDIIRVDKVIYKGELKEYPRKIPKLKENAVPTIFPNLPSYLTNTASTSMRLSERESENVERAVQLSLLDHKKYVEERAVKDLDDIVNHFLAHKVTYNECWTLKTNAVKVSFCYIDINTTPVSICGSISFTNNLEYEVYVGSNKISKRYFPIRAKSIKSLNDWDELVAYVETLFLTNNNKQHELNFIDTAIQALQQCDDSEQIAFLCEQLTLYKTAKNNRRYTNHTMIFAASMYVQSSSCYQALYNCKLLCIPHPRNIKKLISSVTLLGSTIQGSISYLKSKMSYLEKHELLVNLLMDEIYIEPQLTFKGGSIVGINNNNPREAAKTAQVFMIYSLFSKYKDDVCIIPVLNQTSEQLKATTLDLIIELEKLGFKILSLISDNNAVNRKAFELFSPQNILQPKIVHPVDSTRYLFIMFDSVHILKCIRNNWISKKDKNCSVKFPDMIEEEKIKVAQLKYLQLLYDLEKNSLVKYGHLLSEKVLYPSNIQRQNVKYALNLINEKNVAALRSIAKFYPEEFSGYEDTCTFIEIICNWWKIVNVKSVFESCRFNDKYREAIKDPDSENMQFLKKMSVWLKKWRVSVPISDSLTAPTFQAIITTIDSLLEVVPYLFNTEYDVKYLLLGKFQTECLEGRFEVYRQLSGANFYISFMQLLESERKLRFKSAVLYSSKSNIPLRTLLPCTEEVLPCVKNAVEPFLDNYIWNNLDFEDVPSETLPVLTYIAGYVVQKELQTKKCLICCTWIKSEKEICVDGPVNLIKELDRGKLILPTECALYVVVVVWDMMQHILNCFLDMFLGISNQLGVLHKLCCIKLENQMKIFEHSIIAECQCKRTLKDVLEHMMLRTSKIILNNFIKRRNEISDSSKNSQRKLRKLNS